MEVYVICYEHEDVFNVLSVRDSFANAVRCVKEYVDGGTFSFVGDVDDVKDVRSLNSILRNGRVYKRVMNED